MLRAFLTWKFACVIVAVGLVNAAAFGILYFTCTYGLGNSVLPPAQRFISDFLGPVSRVIVAPHVALFNYAPVSSILIVLGEAIAIYLFFKLFYRVVFWRQQAYNSHRK